MISAQIDKIVAQMLGTENFAKTHVGDDALDTAKQVSSKKIDAANGSWVVRAFKHGDKTFVQVQNPDKEVYYVAPKKAMAESKENKIVVPNLEPRDPNHEILKNKRNAGGAHRDKKRDMKNGEGKYKEKITFKEYLMVEAPVKGSDKVEEHPYSVKILYKGKGRWPKLKGEIYEHDVLIGTFSRDAVQGGYIHPIEYKFRTERSKARFDDFADSLSIEETIEALLPNSALGRAE